MPRRSAPKASRSISDDSTESSNSAEHLAAKKRKPTYLVRKVHGADSGFLRQLSLLRLI